MVYFKTKNTNLGIIWRARGAAVALELYTAVGYNLWSFCIVCGTLVYFSGFGMFGPKQIWQP
jgi:hypothetical protein